MGLSACPLTTEHIRSLSDQAGRIKVSRVNTERLHPITKVASRHHVDIQREQRRFVAFSVWGSLKLAASTHID